MEAIALQAGIIIEIQAKRGLDKNQKFWEAIVKLAHGLTKDPSLYCILLVDSKASGPIKDELRQDLKRLGQERTDDLKGITKEVIERFRQEGIPDDPELFRRLSVRVADFYEGSEGAKLARFVLSQVIADKNQARNAWATLVKDAHDLIEIRGRRDAAALARLLGSESIQLSATGTNLAVIAEGYRGWLNKSNAHLSIPGSQKALPIETSWIQLQVYEPSKQEAFDVENYIAASNYPLIIVGGSGSGKSTLLRRLACRLSASGKTVLLVRLPSVVQRINQGEQFTEAILKVAADGYDIEEDKLKLILKKPDYLLVDGLDECAAHRANIVQKLVEWSNGHSKTRIILPTRYASHEPELFPDWKQVELLPLDKKDDIQKHVRQVITANFTNESDIQKHLSLFEKQIENNKIAALAAQNPLLLGFLIQLFLEGIDFGQRRIELYERVIHLAWKRSLKDRIPKYELDESEAEYALKATGWILQNEPGLSKSKLLKKLGKKLSESLHIKPLVAQKQAEADLNFWEERCIIEYFSFGSQNTVAFVHPSIQEYAAGQYASSYLTSEQLCQWIEKVRREPRWQETIVFAAGEESTETIVKHLLKLDNPEESASTESVLATGVLRETPDPQIKEVAKRLQQRLQLASPSLVFEAAEAALGLSLYAPDIIGTIAQTLVLHPQQWTRLAATRLALACGEDYVDLEILREMFDNIIAEPAQIPVPFLIQPKRRKKYGKHGWYYQNQIILQGSQLLLKKQPGLETIKEIERIICEGRWSIATTSSLKELLIKQILENLKSGDQQERAEKGELLRRLTEFDQLVAESSPQKVLMSFRRRQRQRDAQRAILEAVIRATNTTPVSQEPLLKKPVLLGRLMRAMNWVGELPESDYDVMSERQDLEAVDAVFKGMIVVLEIDSQRLATEAAWILEEIKHSDPYDLDAIEAALNKPQSSAWAFEQIKKFLEEYKGSLLRKIPQVPVEPQWENAREVDLSPEDLVRALKHPSECIVQNAMLLLMHGAGESEAADLVRELLREEANLAPQLREALEHWTQHCLE